MGNSGRSEVVKGPLQAGVRFQFRFTDRNIARSFDQKELASAISASSA
jgi:hypothetical protein